LADRELKGLQAVLREHVDALAVHIGSRTPSKHGISVRAGNYVHSVFKDAGLSVREQNYQ